jgi:predicted nucleic acid-binding protein
MLELVLDTNALITCCQATTRDGPAIESVLEVCALRVAGAVHREVLAPHALYPDAGLANRIIGEGRIEVIPTSLPPNNVLDHYRLGAGEKESIALYLNQADELDFLVTDDRLAYVVGQRCGISCYLFLDMVVELVERKLWKRALAEDVVKAAQHRFSGGFVPHTLTILKTGDRRCLK